MPLLSDSQISQSLASLSGWALGNKELERSFSFPDFVAAMRFVNAVAEAAEKAGHHPDIDIRYNKVRLALSSHDAGGITDKDTRLASEINAILKT